MVHRYLGSIALLLSLLLMILVAGPVSAENGSLLFDGVDDYVTVPEPVDLQGALTLEAWVKVDTVPGGGRIMSNRNSANGYEFYINRSGDTYSLGWSENGNQITSTDFTSYVGVWTHVALAWGGPPSGVMSLYVNGLSQSSFSFSLPINPTTGPFRIGAMGSGEFNFRGQIDEVRIWSAALDGATIASWMSRPLAADHPNYADLEAYWNFDEGSGQVAHNLAGDARRDGELGSGSEEDTNDPQWQSEGAPVPVNPATIGQIKQRYLEK